MFNPITDALGKPFKVVAYLNDVTKVRREALLNAAFRGALNRLDANVMVANNDLEIIFVNPAAEKMLSRAQVDFRRDLPSFDAAKVMGSSLDTLTRDPAKLRGEIERLTDLVSREESIGGRAMKTIMSPMKDESGRRLGTVLEWFDRTQEVATETELQQIIARGHRRQSRQPHFAGRQARVLPHAVHRHQRAGRTPSAWWRARCAALVAAAANQGDLTTRIDTVGKPGLLVEIGSGSTTSRTTSPSWSRRPRWRPRKSAVARTRSAGATRISRSAPRSRLLRWKKPLRRWRK